MIVDHRGFKRTHDFSVSFRALFPTNLMFLLLLLAYSI